MQKALEGSSINIAVELMILSIGGVDVQDLNVRFQSVGLNILPGGLHGRMIEFGGVPLPFSRNGVIVFQ